MSIYYGMPVNTHYNPIDLCNIFARLAEKGFNIVGDITLANAFIRMIVVSPEAAYDLSIDTHHIKFTHVENLQITTRSIELGGDVLENTTLGNWATDHSN